MQAIVEGREHIRTTAEEDRACEAAVLRHVLSLHPTPLTFADVIRELGGEDDFGQRDAIERAVRDLIGSGLLHRSEPLVLPSRAALRFDELTGD
jgi:hypothetical protein